MLACAAVVPVHEQDEARGGCAFSVFLDQTPEELKERKLFDTVAVPLFPVTPPSLAQSLTHSLRSF